MSMQWQLIAQRKQEERHARIPKAWLLPAFAPPTCRSQDVRAIPAESKILSPQELAITNDFDATALAEELRAGRLSAEEVTVAFCKRAAIAQQVCNCLTEIFFEDAITRARWLDQEHKRTGKTVGPLHGIPVSLKDTFQVRGYDASLGIASLAFQPSTENSTLVNILLAAGAVLYCKTNLPQTMMALDSDNKVFGRTWNPRNRKVTAGGSSGGEGALIAMRGSILGVGTDIGGSIRIPAMCNGLYGIKPSANRIPYGGQHGLDVPGEPNIAIEASAGPLATSLRDCDLFLKVVAAAKPWNLDAHTFYGPWNFQGELPSKDKLLIGILGSDGLMTPLPPIQAVLEETKQALEGHGHTTIEVSHPDLRKCQSLANNLFAVNGSNRVMDLLDETGEPLINWLSGRTARKPAADVKRIQQLTVERQELQNSLLSLWHDPVSGRELDAIVCPVAPHPTPPIDKWNGVSYTSSFVLLDYAAGTIPVRDVEEKDLKLEMEAQILGSWDRANRELWDSTKIDRRVYLDTTLCIQVLAPRLQERRLAQAMAIVEEAIQGYKRAPQSKM